VKTVRHETAFDIAKRLIDWYGRQSRDLPWRKTRDPYHIWISEIMLQQTQVQTVIPYYYRFLKEFPTIEALAQSSLQDVLKAWENLGYYARARHVHEAAKTIMHQFGGQMPDTWDALIHLPGIGSYTAGAILSIAFRKRFPAVDGNVRRVLSRFFAIADPIDQPRTQRHLYQLAEKFIPDHSPGSFNQALMELGSLICKSRNPSCYDCPVQSFCQAYDQMLQHQLPVRAKRDKRPQENATAAILRDNLHRILVVQRPVRGLLGSLWKFPGGLILPKESLTDGLRRTILEELGLQIEEATWITSLKHTYTHFRMTLHIFHCTYNGSKPRALTCQGWKWVSIRDLEKLPFSKADRKAISAI
jgi:A/G-specific adenine glycosylase